MNNTPVDSDSPSEMTHRQVWFHFWVKSFPFGVHTKDTLNPSFYCTKDRIYIRRIIHFIVLIVLSITVATLASLVFSPNQANAQGRVCNSSGICYGSSIPGGSSYTPDTGNNPRTYNNPNYHGGAYGYDPNNVGHMGSHAPDPCVRRYLGMLSAGYNSPTVIQNAYNSMAMCMLGRNIRESGYLPIDNGYKVNYLLTCRA